MQRRSLITGAASLLARPLFGAEGLTEIQFVRKAGQIDVLSGGEPLSAFVFDPKWDKPFVYPLRTTSGRIVSRGFPLEQRQGDSTDHVWHRGIWYGHGDINGQDFWRELGREKTGTLKLLSEPRVRKRGRHAAIQASFALQPVAGTPLGTVHQEWSFAKHSQAVWIGASIAVHADRGMALKFGDTDDGGFGIRLREEFREDAGAVLRNSEGLETTEEIWGKPARWVEYAAKVGGADISVIMFDHPRNLRHPGRWHARGYGLCAANPFGLQSFLQDRSRDGSHTLPPGGQLAFRYRIIIHEGGAGSADIEDLYSAFARGK